MIGVIDVAINKAYNQTKKIHWIYAGEKSCAILEMTNGYQMKLLKLRKSLSFPLKGPLTTPVGGGIRSINVALEQELDLCLFEAVRYFKCPSPLKNPENTDMVIFRKF